jgi:hypothetical protein
VRANERVSFVVRVLLLPFQGEYVPDGIFAAQSGQGWHGEGYGKVPFHCVLQDDCTHKAYMLSECSYRHLQPKGR